MLGSNAMPQYEKRILLLTWGDTIMHTPTLWNQKAVFTKI